MRGSLCREVRVGSRICLDRWQDVCWGGGWSEASGAICSLPDSSLPASFSRYMACSLLSTDMDTLPKLKSIQITVFSPSSCHLGAKENRSIPFSLIFSTSSG